MEGFWKAIWSAKEQPQKRSFKIISLAPDQIWTRLICTTVTQSLEKVSKRKAPGHDKLPKILFKYLTRTYVKLACKFKDILTDTVTISEWITEMKIISIPKFTETINPQL